MWRILIALIWPALGGPEQGQSPLADPPVVDEVTLPLIRRLQSEDLADEQKSEAATRYVEHLLTLAPGDLPYGELTGHLLACQGQRALPISLDASWRGIQGSWEGFEPAIAAVIARGAPEPPGQLAGAIQVAQRLRLSGADTLGALAGLLSRDDAVSEPARTALRRITAMRFASRAEYEAWAVENLSKGRAAWLEAAIARRDGELEQVEAAVLEHCRARLEASPADAWALMSDPLPRVRALAYDKLAAVPPRNPGAESNALRDRLKAEEVPELRHKLVRLIPRFIENEAVLYLTQSMERPDPEEKARAATALMLIKDRPVAANRVLSTLESVVYADGAQRPETEENFRRQLVNSLEALASAVEDQARVRAILERGLELERADAVRLKLFEAVGVVGNTDYLPGLEAFYRPEGQVEGISKEDRLAALEAATEIAARELKRRPVPEGETPSEEIQRVVRILKTKMKDVDEDVRYRAIQGAVSLRRADLTVALARQVGKEERGFLREELFKTLAQVPPDPDGEAFQELLAYAPRQSTTEKGEVERLETLYVAALRAQAGHDLARLVAAEEELRTRGELGLADRFLRGVEPNGWNPEERGRLLRLKLYAETRAWLAANGRDREPDSQNEDLSARLLELQEVFPESWETPLLAARVHLRGNRPGDAVESWNEGSLLVELELLDLEDRIVRAKEPEQRERLRARELEVRLTAARVALELGRYEEGLELLSAFGGEAPAPQAGELSELRQQLREASGAQEQAREGAPAEAVATNGEPPEEAEEAPEPEPEGEPVPPRTEFTNGHDRSPGR